MAKNNNTKKSSKSLLIITLVFVLLLGGAYMAYSKLSADNAPDNLAGGAGSSSSGSASSSQEEPEKVKVPNFMVTDVDGNEVHLYDFIGTKPVVLNFWASWCGPCKSEMPDFNKVYGEMNEEIQFLMINATDGQRETVEKASKFVEEQGYEFPVYYDTEFDASATYGVRGLPTTFFIDKDGYAVAAAQSAISEETLREGISMILPG